MEKAPEVAGGSDGMAASGDGVNVRVVDENWQVSTMPEDKQYFSLDVRWYLLIKI